MARRITLVLVCALVVCMPAVAQSPSQYLDVMVVKVKPEKRAEFDQICRKVAQANRKNGGDAWLAAETIYGEGNTVYFISNRRSYGDVEKAYGDFMAAMTKGVGQATATKLMQDFNACLVSSRSEFRRRRPDLSIGMPTDEAGMARLTGESRWYRTTAVRIRPGHIGQFEELLKAIKAAREQKGGATVSLVSQSMSGQTGTVFYLTSLVKSLAGLDPSGPTLQEILGEEGFRNYVKTNQEAVLGTDSFINRFIPELSSPTEAIAAVDVAFWNPKLPAATPGAPKVTEGSAK